MGKPQPFPHHYTVALADGQLTAPPRAAVAAGAPPQFGGVDTVWSPEEMLVGAALTCLWTTFVAYARRDQLEVARWSGRGEAVLVRGEQGAPPTFTQITLTVELTVAAADAERARALLITSEERCIISHALKVPVALQIEVHPT